MSQDLTGSISLWHFTKLSSDCCKSRVNAARLRCQNGWWSWTMPSLTRRIMRRSLCNIELKASAAAAEHQWCYNEVFIVNKYMQSFSEAAAELISMDMVRPVCILLLQLSLDRMKADAGCILTLFLTYQRPRRSQWTWNICTSWRLCDRMSHWHLGLLKITW